MKLLLLTVALSLSIAASSQADLLTSFFDDFDRGDGGIGSNYTVARGNDYVISDNELYQSAGDEPIT